MRAQETKLREPLSVPKLEGNLTNSALTQPYEGLLSVFEDGVVEQMNDTSVSSDPMGFFQLLGKFGDLPASQGASQKSAQCRNTVPDLAAFRKNLRSSIHKKDGLLDKIELLLKEEPILMAGGAVLRALTANQASGLKWVEMKAANLIHDARNLYVEIENEALRQSLTEKLDNGAPLEFTQAELDRFALSDLSYNSYIHFQRRRGRWMRREYYQPAFTGADADSRRGHLLGQPGDIDLFVCSQDATRASEIAHKIFLALVEGGRDQVRVMRGPGVINIEVGSRDVFEQPPEGSEPPPTTIQIALRLYESPAEVLLGFDCDCCCVGYDGERVWALPRAVRAIRYGTNILNPLHAWPSKASYEFRLVKYALRGYSISVPAFETVDVDLAKIIGMPLSKLKGFARLLRIAMAFDAGYSEGGDLVPPYSFKKGMDQCDHHYSSSRTYGDGLRQELGETLKEALGDLEYYKLVASAWHYDTADRDHIMTASMGDKLVESQGLPIGHGLEGWEAVAEATGIDLKVPIKLDDAWDRAKRSREYLNAKETDLDARYFAHAARKKKGAK